MLSNLNVDQLSLSTRFLIISLPSNAMSSISPFVIQNALIGIGGEPKSVKRLRSGDLLIETLSAIQTKSFLQAKKFLNSPVNIYPHKTLNSCRGIISEPDLLTTTDAKILDGFSDQGVIQVRRITIRRDVLIIPTKHKILTFNSPKLPSTIKAGYLNCRIRLYIPNPLRCFKCQRFGHSQTSCRGQQTCSRCASAGHSSTDCILEPKCINCLQHHPSDSKICPKWKIEKQIQEIKTNKNISYPEARKLINPQLSETYAQAAKSSTLNNSTQTDENITKIKCPPLKLLAPLSSKQRPNISTANTTSSSAQAQLLPSISSKTSTTSDPQPPTPILKECKTYDHFKAKYWKKHIYEDCEEKEDSLYESTPVSKRSRRRKTSKTSDAMDTDADPSDTDYGMGLASEEDESLLEVDFKQVSDNPLKGPLSPSLPKK
ncbi:RNA-directed DNA polymerase from mobile element jockey [Trichonephila clavipes]|nr:RNA-directed DNA polymerase from mobile element jockey [Trichonephila clavipes]